jgi:hypothetical protein
VDFSAGNPGAFTDDPEALPQPDVILDPYAATNTGPEPSTVEEPVAEPKEESTAPPPFEAPAIEHSSSFFGKAMVESLKDSDSIDHAPSEFSPATVEDIITAPTTVHVEQEHEVLQEPDYEHGEAASYYRGDPSAPITEEQADPEPTAREEHQAPQGPDHERGEAASYHRGDPSMPIAEPYPVAESKSEGPAPVEQEPIHTAAPTFSTSVMPSFDLPSYMSQDPNWGGLSEHDQKPHDVWSTQHLSPRQQEDEGHSAYKGVIPIPIPIPMGSTGGNASYHSKASSIRYVFHFSPILLLSPEPFRRQDAKPSS